MPRAHALIIDDDQQNLRVLSQLLMLEDMAVTTLPLAVNLAAELDRIPTIHVAFIDLEMPKVDGFQAMRIIRAHPRCRDTALVAYTVHVSELDVAMREGFDSFLGKPLSAEDFPQQLDRILQGERVWYMP